MQSTTQPRRRRRQRVVERVTIQQQPQQQVQRPPGQGISRNARRRRRRRNQLRADQREIDILRQSQPRRRPLGPMVSGEYISRGTQPVTAGDFGIPQDQNCPALEQYLLCLANPKKQMARVPDAYGGGTSLVRSLMVIELNVLTNTTPDSGRFSLLAQPTLGSTSVLGNYKVACVDTHIPWPTGSFDQPNVYMTTDGGQDIRIDPYYNQLTSPGNFFYSCENVLTDGIDSSHPFGTIVNGTLQHPSNLNYGLSLFANVSGGYTYIQLQPGMYYVSVTGDYNVNVTFAWQLANPATGLITQVPGLENNSISPEILLIVNILTSGGALGFSTTEGGALTDAIVTLTITPCFCEGAGTPSPDYGVITVMRPVGMSVLATYNNSTLYDAGMISAACVPPNSCRQSFFADSLVNQTVGQLQNFEKLEAVPGAYSGRLVTGAYAWWAPRSSDDLAFKSPSESIDFEYPCIIVSGQFNPTGVAAGTTLQVLRFEICTVYEFQSQSLLFPQEILSGNQMMIDMALRVLSEMSKAGQNDSHVNFWQLVKAKAKSALVKLGRFAWDNRAAIASTALSML